MPESQTNPKPFRAPLCWIVIAPSIWAIHLLACYLTVAIWCEKFSSDAESGPVGWIVTVYTTIAMTGIAVTGWLSVRKRRGEAELPLYEFDSPEERGPFLRSSAFLLSLLSAVATLFTALTFVFVRSCD